MRLPTRFALLASLFASSGAIAADMLPLKQGLYVPVGRPCRGASNADLVTYWGGKSSIGVAQATCTIKSMMRKGSVFTLKDVCRDLQSGEMIDGGPTVLTIATPTSFRMSGTAYQYCGVKRQF